MHTVLGVYLQSGSPLIASHDFIDASRAIALFRRVIELKVDCNGRVRVAELQMDRLIFLMIGVGQEDR